MSSCVGMGNGELTKKALEIIQDKGHSAVTQASKRILDCQYDSGVIQEALHFYAKSVLPNVLPIFPALISLSSKAVGGASEKTRSVASAMLLITASGDIHDDVVDNSTHKFGNQTIVGRYGKDIALLAGDLLLIQGATAIHNLPGLPTSQRKTFATMIAAGVNEIIKAEALEVSLWRKPNLSAQEFFEVINLKGCVSELHCRIGGLVGGGTPQEVEGLGRYGRAIGVLSTLKEEFVDLSNPLELEHRIKCEIPPYPMLCAMQNKLLRDQLTAVLEEAVFSAKDLPAIREMVLVSAEVAELKAKFRAFGQRELTENLLFREKDKTKQLAVLLEALSLELPLV